MHCISAFVGLQFWETQCVLGFVGLRNPSPFVFLTKNDTKTGIKKQNNEPWDTAKQKQSNGLVVAVWSEGWNVF